MTPQIRSHREYLIPNDIIHMLFTLKFDEKNLTLLTGFQYDSVLIRNWFIYFGEPPCRREVDDH